MPLRKLSIREIRSRPARSLLTLFSIVIGVAAIVATSIATTSARLAQIAMVRAVTGNAALEIEGVGGSSFDATALESVSELPWRVDCFADSSSVFHDVGGKSFQQRFDRSGSSVAQLPRSVDRCCS